MEVSRNKIPHVCQCFKSWDRNESKVYKKKERGLLCIIDLLDQKAEISPISSSEREAMRNANDKVNPTPCAGVKVGSTL